MMSTCTYIYIYTEFTWILIVYTWKLIVDQAALLSISMFCISLRVYGVHRIKWENECHVLNLYCHSKKVFHDYDLGLYPENLG